MARSFDRWEKDPYFSAAEEVQESADRMESTYRTWLHSKKDSSSMWDSDELCRDLRTTLGTTKWQLEEFERAVGASHVRRPNDDAVDRHRNFVAAIENQISNVENSLRESSLSEGKVHAPWVCLDEDERDELALFLTGPPAARGKNSTRSTDSEKQQVLCKESAVECSKSSSHSVEWGSRESAQEKLPEGGNMNGHRRTASACADIGSWTISVFDDNGTSSSQSLLPDQPIRKIPSLSGFFSTESKSKSKSKSSLPKNGFRKCKAGDCHHETNAASLQSPPLTRGINACYEKNKSYLDSCDDCYDKQLYGWYGAIQRQFQRSQYQMLYSRPLQMIIWIVLLLCLIALVTLSVV